MAPASEEPLPGDGLAPPEQGARPEAGGPEVGASGWPVAIERKLEQLPPSPGCYIFLDAKGKALYVGKASSLRARVRSYFGKTSDGRTYFPHIVGNAADLEWVVTASAREALLLENNLIKERKPRFNVKLTDDKTYLSIKLSTQESYPRALLVRRAKKDGALYFGPYASSSAIRQTLRTIRKFFPLRTCTNAEFRQRTRPCIQHQIGRCGAPCVGLQDEASYRRVTDQVALFLRGKTDELKGALEKKMLEDAEALRFEAAARTRDQIRWIEASEEKQRAVLSIVDLRDRDIFGEVREGDAVIVHASFVREGKLVSTHGFTLRSELPTDEVLRAFFQQFYGAERYLPDEVLFPSPLEDQEALEEWLSERKGKRVKILVPERGEKRAWVEAARENARKAFRDREERRRALLGALDDLKARLSLENVPARIECYDISNISGAFAVGSLVVMKDGELEKAAYKRFQIRNVERTDDLSALTQVLERRFRRGSELPQARATAGVATAPTDAAPADTASSPTGKKRAAGPDWRLPDLLLIDGGPPQLEAVRRVMEARGITGVDLATIAKTRSERGRVIRAQGALGSERIFRPGREEPVLLPEGSPGMHLLQLLRDEAHRFALGYHRELRRKKSFRSTLDDIPGVGPKRKRALLEHFGSLEKLREASVADLAACPHITPSQAEAIHAHLQEA